MKAWMSPARAGSVCSFALAGLLLTGCGGGDAGSSGSGSNAAGTTETSQRSSAPAPTSAARAASERLVGTWLGVAYVEDEKVAARLAQVTDPTQRMSLDAQLATFQSMVVGAEFAADGSFTIEAELTPAGGQTARDATAGTWTIKSEDGDVVVVESKETKTDGLFELSEKEYTFIDDDHFVWIPAVSQDLRECDAMIVFEKQTASTDEGTGVAEAPGSSVPR